MAVLAAEQNGDGRQAMNLVEQIFYRVIWATTFR